MLAGEVYSIFDPDLAAQRKTTKDLLWQFNRTEDEPARRAVLEQLLAHIGEGSVIWPPFFCSYGVNTHIGDHAFLSYQCTVLDNNEVRIGDHVMVGPAVQIYTAAHPLEADPRIRGLEVAKPVVIRNNAWLGGGAIVLPGVTIGPGAVVGAGAVVTRDVPPDTAVAGNPARVIREIEQ
jgi:maltose O-acetyltransferase